MKDEKNWLEELCDLVAENDPDDYTPEIKVVMYSQGKEVKENE